MFKKIFAFIFLIGFLVTPLTVSAQFGKASDKLAAVGGGTGLESNLEVTVSAVIKGVLSLAGTIFLILTVYAGILWMTAQGNEEQVTKAKGIVTQAIIGLAITLAAYAITAFVTGKLSPGSSGAAPSGGAPAGGGSPAVVGVTCTLQGGECIPIVKGENPCDPPGLDKFSGTVLSGSCTAGSNACCELDASAEKCGYMGGVVITGECANGLKFKISTNVGQNENCCNK